MYFISIIIYDMYDFCVRTYIHIYTRGTICISTWDYYGKLMALRLHPIQR